MITATHLTTSDGGLSGGTSFNTASITPSANKLVLLAVWQSAASGTPNTPTVSGNGLTWVQVATYQLSYNTARRMTIFRAMGASPSAGAVTVDFGGQSQTFFSWSISEFDGVAKTGTNGSDAVVQSSNAEQNGTYSGLTVTLGTFANAANAAWGYILNGGTNAITSGSGFTELSNISTALGRSASEFKLNDTTVDWSWSSQNNNSQAIAVEIQSERAIKKINGVARASIKKLMGKTIIGGNEIATMPLASDANLKAYYRFESGALTTDSSGNGYTLTNNNTVGEGTGKFGGCSDFGSANTNKSFSIASDVGIAGNSPMSIVFWINIQTAPATNGYYTLVQHRSTTGADRAFDVIYFDNSGTKRLYINASATLNNIVQDLGTSAWHLIGAVRTTTTSELYVDGVWKQSAALGSTTYSQNKLLLGGDTGTFSSTFMDDATFFNDGLTATEMSNIYNTQIKKYMGVSNV